MESAKWRYGRLSAGFEENVAKIEEHKMGSFLSSSAAGGCSTDGIPDDSSDDQRHTPARYDISSRASTFTLDECFLTALPAELIDGICHYLSPQDLNTLSLTCQNLRGHALKDVHWQHHVQDCIPGLTIKSPTPCKTYRELYFAHDPHWFLPKYKVWFSDLALTGKLVIARYDPRRGCIEGYRVVAERTPPEYEPWEYDDEVIIHSFEPKVQLHLDIPVLQLDALSLESLLVNKSDSTVGRFHQEKPMQVHSRAGTFSNFFLTRSVPYRPGMEVWPPPHVPSRERVRNQSHSGFRGSDHKPQKRSEVCTKAFRIRKWVRMNGMMPIASSQGIQRQMEDVQTYSTLDPKLYTPTPDYPWRGIWVGDYSGHGCEFLLMHQPERGPFDDPETMKKDDETDAEFTTRQHDERIYRGRIEAIKLTGDPNIPRGEHTFIADDIGEKGFVRVSGDRFKGARIVRSRGHIAERFFRADKFIESQLIMISPDRMAQYWVGFGHVSFYERVKIDDFLNPANDPHLARSAKGDDTSA